MLQHCSEVCCTSIRRHPLTESTICSTRNSMLMQAGGWLGRVYMLDFGTKGIDRYVTLGSPHAPPPAGAAGVVDQTRGILTFCNDSCPGAFHQEVGDMAHMVPTYLSSITNECALTRLLLHAS